MVGYDRKPRNHTMSPRPPFKAWTDEDEALLAAVAWMLVGCGFNEEYYIRDEKCYIHSRDQLFGLTMIDQRYGVDMEDCQ